VDARRVEEHGIGEDLGDLQLQPGRRLGDVFQQQDIRRHASLLGMMASFPGSQAKGSRAKGPKGK